MSQITLDGVDVLPPDQLRQQALSQWFTPAEVAGRLVSWIGTPKARATYLEPSAGSGRIVRAIQDLTKWPRVSAVEIDPKYADKLRAANAGSCDTVVDCCDYLERPAPEQLYDYAVLNPPYEDGKDARFVSKAMDESHHVIALLRLCALETKRQYSAIWSRVESREWRLISLAVFVSRPVFDAGDDSGSPGGMTAFCAVKLRRSLGVHDEAKTDVEWWT